MGTVAVLILGVALALAAPAVWQAMRSGSARSNIVRRVDDRFQLELSNYPWVLWRRAEEENPLRTVWETYDSESGGVITTLALIRSRDGLEFVCRDLEPDKPIPVEQLEELVRRVAAFSYEPQARSRGA